MKLDIKSILILVLLAGCLIFGYMWYFKSDNYKKELKELRAENEKIGQERDSINKNLKKLEIEFDKLKIREQALQQKIDSLQIEIDKSKQSANRTKAELDRIRQKLAETRRKIKEFRDNPPNRTGDDLLNSIKIKTTK